MSGALTEGEALPSIRALAKDLRISVITTKRAYDELEKGGFIYAVAAKGCYVAPMAREQQLREIEGHMRRILELARPLSLSHSELMDLFSLIAEEDLNL